MRVRILPPSPNSQDSRDGFTPSCGSVERL
ncbi:hypothetical protein CPT_Mydo_200 [Proteus phage Mydo]|uniref:Uncharacterized protein n=1 Tax=Proteus phage Mydo TaxID=2483610 RepID=A0A3G8F1I2_9CAUD|nr:hypothetical protein HWB97_gp256 [Proteus phage Mydo]AZF87769.1 hypothetical protein CPT_Mydo_200 [Proteus phage Mydo]